MNERGLYIYKSYIKKCFVPRRLGEACHWANIVSCPLFANVIKNNITNLVIPIIVCLLKTE